MKLTYENCDKLRLTRKGNLVDANYTIYNYKEQCKNCGEPYLGPKGATSCCVLCASPMRGKIHPQETKDKISLNNLNKNNGDKNPNWKGGVKKLDIPLYDTYNLKLCLFEEVRIFMLLVGGVVYKSLQVRCNESSCRKWFRPTYKQVRARLRVFNGVAAGQQNFYCSEECKNSCSTFGQKCYPKGFKRYRENNRPDQPQWRKMVLERDNYTCQICGYHSPDGKNLIAHHIDPVIRNPIESMDIDNGITLCKPCDTKVHQLPGCSPSELRCNKP